MISGCGTASEALRGLVGGFEVPITAHRFEDQVVLRIPTPHDEWGSTHCDHHMSVEDARALLKQLKEVARTTASEVKSRTKVYDFQANLITEFEVQIGEGGWELSFFAHDYLCRHEISFERVEKRAPIRIKCIGKGMAAEDGEDSEKQSDRMRAIHEELARKQEPLGKDFEAVWDENRDRLYED